MTATDTATPMKIIVVTLVETSDIIETQVV
jgi:hypothetical protein